MEIENTAIRLKKIMDIKNLKQSELLKLTEPFCNKYNVKMNKSDISQYLSGKTKPNQYKLAILSMVLGVNESWLIGYDVPMERVIETTEISKEQKELLSNYNKLNTKGKDKLIDYSNDLVDNPKYTYEEPETFAAHSKENGDIEGNNRDIEKIKKLIMEDKSR